MRDMHCHILPAVDDGSPDMETSLVMLDVAKRAGVTSIVCTPHVRSPYFKMEMLARDPALVGRMGPVGKTLSGVMYRLALNNGSHLRDRVASLSPTAIFEPYSYEEKRVMARCVLVMLSRLDPDHVVKHLRNFGVSPTEVQ